MLLRVLVVLIAAFGLSVAAVPLAFADENVDYVDYVPANRAATQLVSSPYTYDEPAIQSSSHQLELAPFEIAIYDEYGIHQIITISPTLLRSIQIADPEYL